MNDDADAGNTRMGGEGRNAVGEQGPAAQGQILFGKLAAQTLSTSGGDDQGNAVGHNPRLAISPGCAREWAATLNRHPHFAKRPCRAGLSKFEYSVYSPAMMENIILGIAALVGMVPAALLSWRGVGRRNILFWLLLGVALAGVVAGLRPAWTGVWDAGLASAVWITIGVSLLLFSGLAAVSRHGWRLGALLYPYLILAGGFAVLSEQAPHRAVDASFPEGWLVLHIALSVLTYGLATLAAVACLGAAIQERALKRKRSTRLSRILPSVADGETLQRRLLIAAELVLGVGLLSGMVLELARSGTVLIADHKTLLSLAAFGVIAALLVMQRISGVRGRQAARSVLFAYLLLTLAYPGVKFVTDILAG